MQLSVKSIRVAIVLLALPLLLSAEPVSQLRPTDYVNDFAHVLDQTTIAQLDNICQQLDQKAHAQIAVVTINSLDGSDIESYAVALYKQWGIGSKATDHGVLILLAVQDRKYRIEVGYGLEPILPDGKVGGFGREAVPLLRQNDYNGAVSLMTSRVADVIAQDAGIQLTGARPAIAGAAAGAAEQRPVAETAAHSRHNSSDRAFDLRCATSCSGCFCSAAVAEVRWRRLQRRRRLRRRRRRLRRIWRRQFRRRRRQRQLVDGSAGIARLSRGHLASALSAIAPQAERRAGGFAG